MHETRVQSLGREVPLEKGMTIHSSILAWRTSRTEKPGRLQSVGSQSRTRLSDWTELNWTQIYDIWERKRVHIFIDKLFPSNSIQNIDLANTFLAVVQWCIAKTKKKSMILQKVCSQVANIQNECFPFSQIQFEVFMFFRFMQSI